MASAPSIPTKFRWYEQSFSRSWMRCWSSSPSRLQVRPKGGAPSVSPDRGARTHDFGSATKNSNAGVDPSPARKAADPRAWLRGTCLLYPCAQFDAPRPFCYVGSMRTKPPCRGWGIGQPNVRLNPDGDSAMCPVCGQQQLAHLNEKGYVEFNIHYPRSRGRSPNPKRQNRRP